MKGNVADNANVEKELTPQIPTDCTLKILLTTEAKLELIMILLVDESLLAETITTEVGNLHLSLSAYAIGAMESVTGCPVTTTLQIFVWT